MSRRRILVLVLPAAVVSSMAAAWLLWPRTAITRENAARIQPGITRADVEALLGGPPRDEATGPVSLDLDDRPEDGAQLWLEWQFRGLFQADPVGPHASLWGSNRVVIWVQFDGQDRVTACTAFPMRRVGETPLALVRRWLGL